MSAVDATRLRRSVHEAGHVVVAQNFGRKAIAVYFSDDGAATLFEPGEPNGSYSRLVTTLGGIVAERLHEDPTWRRFRTEATRLTESSDDEAKRVRIHLALSGKRWTKASAVDYLTDALEETARILTARGVEFAEEVEAIYNGEREPRAYPEGAKIAYQNGKPVGYVREHVYTRSFDGEATYERGGVVPFENTSVPSSVRDYKDLPDVRFAEPEAPRSRKARRR